MSYSRRVINRRYTDGQRFGRLTVVCIFSQEEQRGLRFLCVCDCGNINSYLYFDLQRGHTSSCGCMRREVTAARASRHGYANTNHKMRVPEYICWQNMKSRCLNPKNPQYEDWGGRGIKVCKRWRNSFPHFLSDMGRKPHQDLTIERINNEGNYEPGNCKWASREEQNKNKRPRKDRICLP
jgi:hypothetical protein